MLKEVILTKYGNDDWKVDFIEITSSRGDRAKFDFSGQKITGKGVKIAKQLIVPQSPIKPMPPIPPRRTDSMPASPVIKTMFKGFQIISKFLSYEIFLRIFNPNLICHIVYLIY